MVGEEGHPASKLRRVKRNKCWRSCAIGTAPRISWLEPAGSENRQQQPDEHQGRDEEADLDRGNVPEQRRPPA